MNIIGNAQDTAKLYLKGNPEFLPNEIIDNANRDLNGSICAGIVIISDIEGLSFDSNNGIVKLNRNPGKDILFLSPDERTLTVMKSGYEPLHIILNELGIHLQSGKVWQLKVTGDKSFLIQDKGSLTIDTTPSGALIRIDGFPTFSEVTPFTLENFSAIPYKITLHKNDYHDIDTLIIIEKNNTRSLAVKLIPKFGYLNILSPHQDFNLYIDGEKNNSINPIKLPVGEHQIRVSKKYYRDFIKTVLIMPDDNPNHAVSLNANLVRKKGILEINANPPQASIIIDGKIAGYGLINKQLDAGLHKITISADGFKSEDFDVEIMGDDVVSKIVSLSKNSVLKV